MTARRRDPPRAYPTTADDDFTNRLREECAKAGAQWLKQSVNIQRPIGSLTLAEFSGLTEAITARWIVLVSRRTASPVTQAERDAVALLV